MTISFSIYCLTLKGKCGELLWVGIYFYLLATCINYFTSFSICRNKRMAEHISDDRVGFWHNIFSCVGDTICICLRLSVEIGHLPILTVMRLLKATQPVMSAWVQVNTHYNSLHLSQTSTQGAIGPMDSPACCVRLCSVSPEPTKTWFHKGSFTLLRKGTLF